jgi:hypothetical protein
VPGLAKHQQNSGTGMKLFFVITVIPQVGIGIKKSNAGIGIPAFVISVRYRTKNAGLHTLISGRFRSR